MKELCPNMDSFRNYWKESQVIEDSYDILLKAYEADSDGTICAAKAIVECACKTLVDELDDPLNPIKNWPNSPIKSDNPTIASWMGAATTLLKLTNSKTDSFNGVIGQYNKLVDKLGAFRSKAGSISHGKTGFEKKLSRHHRRSAVLIADTVIGFLHDANEEHQTDPSSTYEPYERFDHYNCRIDNECFFHNPNINDDGLLCVSIDVANNDTVSVEVTVSELLFGTDKSAYKSIAWALAGGKND